MKQKKMKQDDARTKDIIEIRDLLSDTIKSFRSNSNATTVQFGQSDCSVNLVKVENKETEKTVSGNSIQDSVAQKPLTQA